MFQKAIALHIQTARLFEIATEQKEVVDKNEYLESLLLAVDLDVDAVGKLDLLPVLEPLGDGIALAQLDLEEGLLLAGGHRQRFDLLRELRWQF